MPGTGCKSNADDGDGNGRNAKPGGKARQVHLPGASKPLAKNNYIHVVRPGCVSLDRVLVMQVAKSLDLSPRSLIRVVVNLLSLLNSVAPLS